MIPHIVTNRHSPKPAYEWLAIAEVVSPIALLDPSHHHMMQGPTPIESSLPIPLEFLQVPHKKAT
jgi:hypothetical protein